MNRLTRAARGPRLAPALRGERIRAGAVQLGAVQPSAVQLSAVQPCAAQGQLPARRRATSRLTWAR